MTVREKMLEILEGLISVLRNPCIAIVIQSRWRLIIWSFHEIVLSWLVLSNLPTKKISMDGSWKCQQYHRS